MATTVLSSPFSYRDKISGSSHSTCYLDSCHVFFIALSACWPCSYPYSLPCSLFLTQHPEKLFGSLNKTMLVQCYALSWLPALLLKAVFPMTDGAVIVLALFTANVHCSLTQLFQSCWPSRVSASFRNFTDHPTSLRILPSELPQQLTKLLVLRA